MKARIPLALVLVFAIGSVSCGGGSVSTKPAAIVPNSQSNTPVPSMVVLVALENESYVDVIGSSSAPYLTSLAQQNTLMTNFYANTHPSIGNYFMLTSGTIVTNDDAFNGTVTADNLVRRMNASGVSWKVYAESLPSTGYLLDSAYPYVRKHNPFAYFSDVANDPAQALNIVKFSSLAGDASAGPLPRFVYILPNNQSNGHDCPPSMSLCTNQEKIAYSDNWLKTNLSPILSSTQFQQSGLLIITYDEAIDTDSSNGGGKIAVVIAGPKAKQAFSDSNFYQHQNTLRLICDVLGLSACPNAAANASGMSEVLR